jgi:hypothetical protein
MQTSFLRVHGQRSPTLTLSTSSTRLNRVGIFKRHSSKVCTTKPRLLSRQWGLPPYAATTTRGLYTGAACSRPPDRQGQKDGGQSPRESFANEEQELRVLERAKAFGIMTMTDLLRECTFEDCMLDRTRLIDRKPYSQDLGLWRIVLDFQRLRFGWEGVRKVWHFMKYRAGMLDEFFQGPSSDYLWATLISAGLKHHDFLMELCKYEIRMGTKRPSLYVDVVGSLLASHSYSAAYRFSHMLQPSHPVTSDDAYELFMQACDSEDERALENFCNLCKTIERIRIYSRAVPHLCSQERFLDAWTMHKFLMSRGDLPSDFESIKPMISYIASKENRFEEFLQDLKNYHIAYEAQARQVQEHEKSIQYGIASGNLNIVSSRTLGVQPARLSDKFVARAFATRAFSFDFILQGLRLLGLREIGPLAFREISVSAATPAEIRRRLDLLKELGVDSGSSMYARVVISIATQGRATLLSDILASDQHPDVFEDLDLQEELLAQYYRDSDWRQVDRTLAILRVGNQEFLHNERLSTEEASFNVLLRSALRAGDWSGATKIMAKVKHQGCRLTTRTLRSMHDTILPRREPAQMLRHQEYFDDVGFLLSLWQSAATTGTQIPPAFWSEPIRRVGMLRRWNDLERLLFWLAKIYSSKAGASDDLASVSKRSNVRGEQRSLRRIFSPSLQRAVVAWAFLSPKRRRKLPGAPMRLDIEERSSDGTYVDCTRGVKVLRVLQHRYGVPIDVPTVRMACFWSLRKRFAPDYSHGQLLKYNLYRKYDASLLPDLLKQLNAVWSGSLLASKSTTLHKQILRPRLVSRPPGILLTRFRRRTPDQPQRHLQHSILSKQQDDQTYDLDEYQSDLSSSQPKANAKVEAVEDVVMYRDIYNVSLEDYRKLDASREIKRSSSE